MTSAERELLIERAAEGGLFDDLFAEIASWASKETLMFEQALMIRRFRSRIAEALGARPRQTTRLVCAVVRGYWAARGCAKMSWDTKDLLPVERSLRGEL